MSTTAAASVDAAMLPAPRASAVARRAPWPLVVVGDRRRRPLRRAARLPAGPDLGLRRRGARRRCASDDAIGPLLRTLLLAGDRSRSRAPVLGTALAWLATRTDLPGRRVLRVRVRRCPLVIPSFVGAFALMAAFAPRGLFDELVRARHAAPTVEGFWARALVLTLFTYPYVYLPVRPGSRRCRPTLEESARAARPATGRGVPHHRAARSRTGAIAAGTLLVFLYCVSEFGAVSLHALRHADGAHRRDAAARPHDVDHRSSLLLAVVAIAVVVAERHAGRAGGRRSTRARRRPAGAARAASAGGGWPAFVVVGRRRARRARRAARACSSNGRSRGLHGAPRRGTSTARSATSSTPALNTAGVSVVAALVAVCGACCPSRTSPCATARALGGTVNARRRERLRAARARDRARRSCSGCSARAAAARPLPDVPAADLRLRRALRRAGAARVAGRGRRRAAPPSTTRPGSLGAGSAGGASRTVELPLDAARRSLAGAGLVLLSTMKELPATLLLAPTGFETLATEIWSAARERAASAEAGARVARARRAVGRARPGCSTIRRMDRLRDMIDARSSTRDARC